MINKLPPRRTRPQIVHKNGGRFPCLQKAEREFQRAKILRAVNQDDVTGFNQLREEQKRIAKATFHILVSTQSLCGHRHIGRVRVRLQTNDWGFGKETRKDQRALRAGAA